MYYNIVIGGTTERSRVSLGLGALGRIPRVGSTPTQSHPPELPDHLSYTFPYEDRASCVSVLFCL